MIGREREQEILMEAATAREPRFVAVYGRRRVGKTFLVRQTFRDSFAFHHTGMATGSMPDQLKSFQGSLMDFGYRDCPLPADWIEAFRLLRELLERSRKRRKVVFIDELPWLDTRKSRFLPAFEHFWNGWASGRKDVCLVVCGSATSWILNKVIRSRGGLHNRVTDRIRLDPFSLGECERYAKSRGLAFDRFQIVQLYMVFGGVPFYWSQLKPGGSMSGCVDSLLFARKGALRGEFDELFRSLFRRPEPYVRIVEELGTRKSGLTREEIARKAAPDDSGHLTGYLAELEECGFVRKYEAFGKRAKGALYQLVDPFVLFHYAFVRQNARGNERFWSHSLRRPVRTAWEGIAFELVCLEHVDRIKAALGVSGVLTTVSSWSCPPADGRPGAQVDLVLERGDRVVDLCEMKFSPEAVRLDGKAAENIRNKAERFIETTGTRSAVHVVVVTPVGLLRNRHAEEVQNVVTMADLFL